ncbi:MAG TPA: hypothetical protein VGR10_02015, partial [Thermoleophilaceae bacterium]|nr:hypothetical protein [Thermoleophilaceae bacterium]
RRARPWKRLLGPASYTVGAASAALSTPPLRCEVRVAREQPDASSEDGAIFAGEAWQVMVAVSGAFGAGIRVEPVSPADGKLDLFVVEAGPRARLAAHAWRMRSGRLRPQPGVRHERAEAFALSVPEGTELNLDGEIVPIGRTRFSVDPTGVELVVP